LDISGYSSLMLLQNLKSENEENFIRNEESEEISINCSSSVVVKFGNGFSLNGSLIQLYYTVSSGKYFSK
jgi:hypothetical protein